MNIISNLELLGEGSEGKTYKCGSNEVIKIYHDFLEQSYTEEYILRYKNVLNDSYYFATDTVKENEKIVGYKMNYCKGTSLLYLNPLKVNIDDLIKAYIKLESDTIKLSSLGIKTYDVAYNTVFDLKKIGIIDTVEYEDTDESTEKIMQYNQIRIQSTILTYLIDGMYEQFLNNYKILHKKYQNRYKETIDVKEFLITFKKCLEEYCNKEIKTMNDTKKAIKKFKGTDEYPRFYRYMSN